MKILKLLMLGIVGAFWMSSATGQANASINVLTLNSGQVAQGGVVDVQVTVGNTGPVSQIGVNKVRAQISIPIAIASALPNAQQTGLPPGWTILSNTGGVITVCNGSDVIPVGQQRQVFIKVQGNTIGGPSTVSGVLSFGPGTTVCTGLGTLSGNNTADDISQSTIQVIAAPACSIGVTASAGTIACFGGTTTLTAVATGASGTVEYSVNGGAYQVSNIFTVPAGTYTVIAREASNPSCNATATAVTISQPAQLVAAESHTAILCFGGTSTVTISATGGTAPYTGTGTFTQSAGTQSYTVTDANGCTSSVSVTVAQPSAVTASATSTPVSTIGGTDGTATVTAAGGTSPYNYLWTPGGQTTATATGLSAGSYTVTVTDANGCTATATTTVGSPACNVVLSFTQVNVLCFGASTGSATVTAANTTGTVTYLWSNGQTGATATGLVAGTYSVTVTDGAGCTASGSVTISQPAAALVASSSATAVLCNGGSSTVTVSATGGTTPYTGTGTFSRTAGTYSFTVTDANGCTATTSLTIAEPTALVALSSATAILCNGGSSTVTVSATGGTAPYSGTGTFSRTAGTYSFTVTDANGCTATTSVTITEPTALVASSSATAILCNGGSSTVTVSATGGTAPYSGTGTFSRTAGTYSFTVTDANGCTATTSITIAEPTALVASSSATAILCNGGSSTVTVSATGGTAPYTGTGTFTQSAGTQSYTVTDANGCTSSVSVTVTQPSQLVAAESHTAILCFGGTSTVTISATGGTAPYSGTGTFTQSAGTQSYTVTDANGCTSSVSVTVAQPSAVTASATSTPVTTTGGTNGTATATAAGGTPGYTYLWTPGGQTTATATGLSAGSYTVTVTDANGCTATATTTVGSPACNVVLSFTQVNVLCFGASTGSATVTAVNTTGTVTYLWSNGQTGATATGLAAGTYSVTVTDGAGCTASGSVTISQPAAALVASSSATAVLCNGGSSTVTVSATGGTTPYTGTGTFSRTAGTYSFTVTDANGCTATTSVTITEPTALVASSSATAILCNGGSSTVTVSATGGTAPYTGTGTFSRTAGTYSFTVTDANGCTATTSVTITQPSALTASATSTPVSTIGGTDGTATATAAGGTPGYTYLWTPGGQTTATATGLSAGSYTVTVTDANGCTATATTTVGSPACNVVLSFTQVNVLCFGASTGSATVTAVNTTGTVTYLWSNGQTGATATGLAAGTYSVTVTDGAGCTASGSVTISQPAAALVASSSATAILCNGGSSTVTVSATGGTAPYTGTGTFTQSAGTQSYTVTDANGCTSSVSVTVTQPSQLVAAESHTAILCFGGTSTVTISATGGTAPYSGTGTFTQSAGTQSYTVTDANGCTSSVSVTVAQPSAVTASATSTPVTTTGGTNGTATATAAGGTPGYTYLWTPGGQTTATATGLSAGSYTVTVTDANGCTATATTTVGSPACNVVLSFTQVNVLCFGASTGSATVTAVNTTGTVTYLWSNGQTGATATGLAAGTYSVTVTDGAGCTASGSVTISQPAQLVASSTAPAITAAGGSTTVTVAATGGMAPYSGTGSFTRTAGTYTFTVTDANGCTATTTITLTEPSGCNITLSTIFTNVSCNGGNNAAINLIVAGATGTVTYSWSNGATTEDLSGLTAATYSVTVTDANGCTATASVTVTQPATAVSPSVAVTNAACGNANGAVNLTVTGGTAPYTYLWSNGAITEDLNGVAAGTYNVTVTDANGCTATASAIVANEGGPIVNVAGSLDVACFGLATGSINITVTGGKMPYSFLWSNGAVTEDISGLTAGTYSVTITDANGCTANTNVIIAQPLQLIASSSASPITIPGGTTTVSVSAVGGTAPYSGTGSFIRSAGTYTFTVTDANGCTANTLITIAEPSACNITLFHSVLNATCYGGSDGSINLIVTGATQPVSYAWSNGATTEDITGLSAGFYSVIVTDANGCTASYQAFVSQPSEFIVTAAANQISCNGTTTNVVVSATGGTPPYTGTGTFVRSAGTYTFTVTDANGCVRTASITIATPPPCQTGCTKTQTISQDFVHIPVQANRYIWFSSVIDLEEKCGYQPVIINVTNAKIRYKKNNNWITLTVPDSRIEFSANTFFASTQFINGQWVTKAPLWTLGRNVFMAGLAYQVPSGGIPAGIDDVKWTASININRDGVKIKWKWAAAIYSQFSQSYSSLGIKPLDGYLQNPYFNNNKAGTPNNFKNHLKSGGTGWGGTNYTGSYSGMKIVKCGHCDCGGNQQRGELNSDLEEAEEEYTEKEILVKQLEVIVRPNPSSNYFDLQIRSNEKTAVSVRITDSYGKVVLINNNVPYNSTLRIGDRWASGMYMAEIMQGSQRKIIRLVKAN